MLLEGLNVNVTLRWLDVFNWNDLSMRIQLSRIEAEVRPAPECCTVAELPPVIRHGDTERRAGDGEQHAVNTIRRASSTKRVAE